jgi:hypothetical protein
VYRLFESALPRRVPLRRLLLHPVVQVVSSLAHTSASKQHAIHDTLIESTLFDLGLKIVTEANTLTLSSVMASLILEVWPEPVMSLRRSS